MPNQRAEGQTSTTISGDKTMWEAAREKAAGRSLSSIVRDLLTGWIAGEITLPGDTQGT